MSSILGDGAADCNFYRATFAAADSGETDGDKAELFYGAMKSNNPVRVLEWQQHFLACYVSIPFDDAAARRYGVIRAELERTGMPIGANDLMIAAIAAANGLVLVTHNTREFTRIAELAVEDWENL